MRYIAGLVTALALLFAACDSDAGVCSAPNILPSESPKALGIFRPLGNGEAPDPGSPGVVPYEWTLFLQSNCSQPLEIEEVCIIGDAHNADAEDPAFIIEGPVPTTVAKGDAAAVRLTYDHDQVNRDRDDDGQRDADSIAIVIQSNATNFPTLIVPVCAIIVPADELAGATYSCVSPIILEPGEADRTLCK